MRVFFYSLLFLSFVAPIYSSSSVESQVSEYELFARKYEAVFGKKPSTEIWNLGNKQCARACSSQQCKTGCSTKCTKA